jgi:hypothetical protein
VLSTLFCRGNGSSREAGADRGSRARRQHVPHDHERVPWVLGLLTEYFAMTGRIRAIERQADRIYCVTLESRTGEMIGRFVFTVGQDDLEVVGWKEDFTAYMGPSPWYLNPLFEAILALHHAQALELPSK